MAKSKTCYICQECGSVFNKWMGKCAECHAWNTVIEEKIAPKLDTNSIVTELEFESLDKDITDFKRLPTGINELDRVLGNGLVAGSAVLIGGDPGIGKSTLLLQLVATVGDYGIVPCYITGEESLDQVRLRSKRLGLNHAKVKLLSATKIEDILVTLEKDSSINLIVIDSIQTMYSEEFNSSPGTVSQVKATAFELINYAKAKNIILMLVGHVTKEGQLAGPKVLEHMVDTVLYFEGERGHQFRILRAVKNRFGGVNEIGVFEMKEEGLTEVPNPSVLFLPPRQRRISGTSVFAGMEGTRPILVEMQALSAPSFLPTPRRSVVGWDLNRLSMLIAVLAVRYGLNLGDKEVYLNVVGGLKVNEPAADLAAMCALISSVTNVSLPLHTIVFGEVGLSGEVRPVGQVDMRLKEAFKLGFTDAIVPYGTKTTITDMNIKEIAHIKELKDLFIKTKD